MALRKTILLFLVFCAVGCASLRGHPPSREAVFSRELRRELVGTLKARNDRIRSLRGLATVRYGSRLFGARGETAILTRLPSDLRIDGLSEFGLYDTQLVSSGGQLTIYWAGDNHFYRGLASREQFARYLSVSLNPEEAIFLLAGKIPLEGEEDYVLETRKKGRALTLRGRKSDIELERRETAYFPVRFTAYDVDGSHDYVVAYDDFQELAGTWFPNRLVARFHEPSLKIEVHYRGVEINPPIDKGLFQLKIPDDAIQVKD